MIGSRQARRAAAVVAVAAIVAGCDPATSENTAGERPPPPVDVATPLVKPVTEWDTFTGRFEAVEHVELRARVSGYLQEVHFRDGEYVEKGALLFTIDPRPFEAEAARARAELRRAHALLGRAEKDLARAEQLVRSATVSQERVDDRRADKLAAEAEVVAAEAVVRAANLDLEFTRITAPISGRISDRRIDVGNLVSGGSAQSTPLATIVSLDPIYFVFDTSEADHLKYVRLHRSGDRPSSRDNANPVYVRLIDETEWTRRGEMNFVDNVLDTGSGTIRARAVFDNPDHLLSPGLFGRMRLLGSSEYEAMLLPDEAIVTDQSTKLVFVVDPEGQVAAKRVTLGPVIDGLRVVRDGIAPDDRVIVRGLQRARPGGRVTAVETAIRPDGAAAAR